MIRLNDFERRWSELGDAVLTAVDLVGAKGRYILGREVEQFERALASYSGTALAVGVGSGLDAIEIALRAVGVGPGCSVLTTPLSAFATSLAILRCGARPVFCDVDQSGCIDLDRCSEAIRRDSSISTVLPVHLYGHAVDLDRLVALSQEYGVTIVEDCAQSIGARSRGRPVGTASPVAALSFYPTKNLGALGDGGAILASNTEMAKRARSLRNYGETEKYVHDLIGLNSRLDELHAAVLSSVFLPRLPSWTERRRAIARRYLAEIANASIVLPDPPEASESVWHLFPVLIAPGCRKEFRAHMTSWGVQTGIHYSRLIPDQKAIVDSGAFQIYGELIAASRFAQDEVSLPIHPYLVEDEVDQVVRACNRWRPR